MLKDLLKIEWSNQPVLTTECLADKFGCSSKNLRDNFNRNKERFIEGKHYFKLEGASLKAFKDDNAESGFAQNLNVLYLWTKRGVARHAKILSTDAAWEVYEVLEDTYFNGGRPQTRLEMYKEMVRLEEERLALEQKCLEEKARADEYQSTHELYEAVTNKGGWISSKTVTDVLNILGLGRTNFYRFLREQGVVTGKNQPMRCHIEQGLMKARYDDYLKQYCVEFSFKGLKYIYAKLVQANKVPSNLTLETWIKYCADLETNHGDSEE